MSAKIFDMKLLNILQSFGSENSLQSAHDAYWLSRQHDRTLHQVAFSLSWQPKHLSLRYDLHAPQYNPQYATNCGSETISFISILPFGPTGRRDQPPWLCDWIGPPLGLTQLNLNSSTASFTQFTQASMPWPVLHDISNILILGFRFITLSLNA